LRVCLINLEDNRSAINKRIAAAMKHYRLTPADVGDRLFIKAKGEIKIKIATQPNGRAVERNEALINGLIDFLVTNEIDVLSIDPFVKTHGIHENDNDGIQAVIECYDEVAEKANCAVHIWHHTRKSGGGEVTIESARGAIAFVDACRSANILETMTKAEGQKLKIEKPSSYFREFNGKRNFAPPMDQSTWFKLVSVEIDNGGPVFGDDVGVVEHWQHPGTREANLSPSVVASIMEKVGRQIRWRDYPTADMWVGKAVAEILNLDPADNFEQIKGIIKKLKKTGALKETIGRDAGSRRDKTFVVAGNWVAPGFEPNQPDAG
jgi:RecA-family ATPase